MTKKKHSVNIISIIQLIINILVAAGFLVALLVGSVLGTAMITSVVLPLIIASLVLCFFNERRTLEYDVIMLMMAGLSFIPVIGIIAKIAGVVLALISTVKVVSN